MLLGAGWRVNFKRVHRLWKQEHLQVPVKQRKRRRLPGQSANGCVRHKALYRNHVWSYDFLVDRTEDGRQLKLLVVIDEFTRECLAAEVGRTFTAQDVMLTLQYLFAVRGVPEHVRSDNGPEFIAKELQRWLERADVRTLYIQKASPWETGYVESFNGKLRDELLNRELFLSVRRGPLCARRVACGVQSSPAPQWLGLADPCGVRRDVGRSTGRDVPEFAIFSRGASPP
jgi:transposase InsO family protein